MSEPLSGDPRHLTRHTIELAATPNPFTLKPDATNARLASYGADAVGTVKHHLDP